MSVIYLLDYEVNDCFSVDLETKKYIRLKSGLISEIETIGYAFEYKGELYAAMMHLNRVCFMVSFNLIPLDTEQHTVERKRVGVFTYIFSVKRNDQPLCSVKYRELFESSPEDWRPHFFVECISWLKDTNSRNKFKQLWTEKTKR